MNLGQNLDRNTELLLNGGARILLLSGGRCSDITRTSAIIGQLQPPSSNIAELRRLLNGG